MGRFLFRVFLALFVCTMIGVILIILGGQPVIRVFKTLPLDTLETGMRITRPTVQREIFAKLTSGHDVDYYVFTIASPLDLRASLQTPAADGRFNPELMLFGSGLPQPTENPSVPIGDKNGAIISKVGTDTRSGVFDISLLTTFYSGPTMSLKLTRPGTYAIAVLSPNGEPGRYILSIGSKVDPSADSWLSYVEGAIRGIVRMY